MCVYFDLERSISKYGLRSKSRGDLIGHIAYHLMRLDERNILSPTPCL